MLLRHGLAQLGGVLCGCALALVAQSQALPTAPAARIFGVDFHCSEFRATDSLACGRALFLRLRAQVEQDYIERRGLAATLDEFAALEAYHIAFERHDRDQRTRKLAELNERLALPQGDAAERGRLLAFREVLVRLARFDSDVDAGTAERALPPPQLLRHVIERTKLEIALYAEYGGAVSLSGSGLFAYGARIALIEELLANGRIALLDEDVARHFRVMLHGNPAIVVRTTAPDFTPFWQRPIPASYIPP